VIKTEEDLLTLMYATIVEEKDIGKIIYVKFDSKEK